MHGLVAFQAYAAARMAESCLLGLAGNQDIWECAYVESNVTKLPYFASKVCAAAICWLMLLCFTYY